MSQGEVEDYLVSTLKKLTTTVEFYVRSKGYKDRNVIDDIVQETVLRVLNISKKRDLFRERISGYVVTTARNTFVAYMKRGILKRTPSLNNPEWFQDTSEPNITPEEAEASEMLNSALDVLTLEDRTLIQDHYFRYMSYETIGNSRGLKTQAAKQVGYRIRKKLRKVLPESLVA
jgi:RNA polymerase sigma factor (sigma-70 family)